MRGIIELQIQYGHASPKYSRDHLLVVGMITDLSRSGIGGRAFNPLKEGEPVIVKNVQFSNGKIECRVPATVLWTKEPADGHRFGISLEEEIDLDIIDL